MCPLVNFILYILDILNFIHFGTYVLFLCIHYGSYTFWNYLFCRTPLSSVLYYFNVLDLICTNLC